MSTTSAETFVVQASTPPQTEIRETISEVDEWQCKASHWLGFAVRFETVLDVEHVKVGLSRTLTHIPALGARVDTTTSLFQFVLSPINNGVVLEYYRRKAANEYLPDDLSTRKTWKEAGLDAPKPGYSNTPGPSDPLFRAKLTVFNGVSFLSIGMSHGLCDGHGVADILQIWSHFCESSSPDGLPEALRRPRTFGERACQPVKPAEDLVELEDRIVSETGCQFNPLSARTFYWRILPRAIWCMSTQHVLEVRVNNSKLLKLKAAVSERLVAEGGWVSRFEVLCAAFLTAKRESTDLNDLSGMHKLHIACDLRGRSERFSKDYFGNAAFDLCKEINDLPAPTRWNLEDVTTIACKVHAAIRSGLSNPEDICKTKDWYEAARHLGRKNVYDVWAPVVLDALNNTGTFVNSWDQQRFLDISMGSASKASCMQAYFGMIKNLLVEVPRHRTTGDSTIHIALSPAHADRFKAMCEQENSNEGSMFPFSVVA